MRPPQPAERLQQQDAVRRACRQITRLQFRAPEVQGVFNSSTPFRTHHSTRRDACGVPRKRIRKAGSEEEAALPRGASGRCLLSARKTKAARLLESSRAAELMCRNYSSPMSSSPTPTAMASPSGRSSTKPRRWLLRVWCCSLRSALDSIWRIRSRVTLKMRPVSSRV
jgi:hypothetical protein